MAKRKKGKGKSGSKVGAKKKKKSGEANDADKGTKAEASDEASDGESDDVEPSDGESDEPAPDADDGESEAAAPKSKKRRAKKVAITSSAESDEDDEREIPPIAPPPPGIPGMLYKFDALLGKVELVAVAFFVLALTFVAVYQFIVVTLLHGKVSWADDMIRYFVFFTAMSAAALAAQQRRMMAIDIVPRLLSPRVRAYLRVVLALGVVFVCIMLVKAGWANRVSELKKQTSTDHIISTPDAMLALPIGAALIATHFFLQAIIEGSYLIRGKVPPEPEVAVH